MSPHKRFVWLGRGNHGNWPYEVGLDFDNSERPIVLAEGSGHGSMGGNFLLQETLDQVWQSHLERCDCLYLREIALAEQSHPSPFTAAEIYQRWQQHDAI